MKSFKEFFYNRMCDKRVTQLLTEWECYALIPNTHNGYVEHSPKTSALTQKHAHVYAKPKGGGKQLYAVNLDGSGHDGSTGTKLPKKHAAYFRDIGYRIPENNILESIQIDQLNPLNFILLFSFTEDQERQILLEQTNDAL